MSFYASYPASGTGGGGGGITALTGDVAASGAGSVTATVEAIQGTTVSGTTGTGNVVFNNAPTLIAPALGTPSALVGTNITGTGSGFTSGSTDALASATTTVNVSSATAPTSGQVLTATSGTAATWQAPATSGTVTSVSVVSANGLAGTVATATSTPAITLSTSVTGILQGNGTAISAASTTGSGAVVLATSPTLVTPALGTPSALVGTNITGTALGLTSGITDALASATTTVNVSSATAPTSGQILTATSGTAATWQAPATVNAINQLTGDVTAGPAVGSQSEVATIAANVVTNSKLAQMAADTIKGNNTAGLANAADLTGTQVTALLTPFIGDSGSGGTQGVVPAPASGTMAAGDFLSSSGAWTYVDQSKPIYPSFSLVNQTSDPTALSKVGNVVLYTGITGKNYAIVIGSAVSTVVIYDVTDEAAPVLVSNTALAGAFNVAVANISGTIYAFVGSTGSHTLYILNITNPYAVTTTTSYTLSPNPGSLYGVAYSGGYCYLATQTLGFTVLDVGGGAGGGTLLAPVQTYQEGGATNKAFGVVVSGTNIYTTNYSTSNPFTIRQIKSWTTTGGGSPSVPSLQQSLQVTTAGEALGISISGNTAFVSVSAAGVNSVNLIDITTPSSMTNITQITPSNTFSSAMVAVASGNYLYIPSGSNTSYGGSIDAYDITTRASPIKIATATTGVANSVFGGIALGNGYIFAGDYGIAPGSAGNLDIFTQMLNTPVAGNITASTETLTSLTPSTALIANASNGIASSVTTSTELSYVHGVTSAIQTQINSITGSGVTSLTGDVTGTGPGATATTVAKIQGTTVSGTTGTGNVVFSTSPTLVTPALGTPSALVGTNITGTALGLTSGITDALASATTTVNVSSATAPTSGQILTATSGTAATWQSPATSGTVTSVAVSGGTTGLTTSGGPITGSGTITIAGTLAVANGGTGVTTSTGTGSTVLSNSPTLVTPALGTPSALVGTNITGTAASLTSGITQALASATTTVNVNSATAPTSGQVLTATSGTAATWQTPAAAGGTVTSVAFADASTAPIYSISGSPVTTSGTLTQTLTTQTANKIFSGPTTGAAAQPAFRALVSADLPAFIAPTQQIFTSGSGTYTTPAGATWLRIRLVGGGGGGGGTGTAGGNGGATSFGTASFLIANGGSGGGAVGGDGPGGSATITGGSATGIALTGGSGTGGTLSTASIQISGEPGASSPFGGAGGGGGFATNTGQAATVNSGSGGGGGGLATGSAGYGGSGGGAGGYIDVIVSSPSSTYAYAVGTAGSAATGTANGGAGGSGIIIVEEHYYS